MLMRKKRIIPCLSLYHYLLLSPKVLWGSSQCECVLRGDTGPSTVLCLVREMLPFKQPTRMQNDWATSVTHLALTHTHTHPHAQALTCAHTHTHTTTHTFRTHTHSHKLLHITAVLCKTQTILKAGSGCFPFPSRFPLLMRHSFPDVRQYRRRTPEQPCLRRGSIGVCLTVTNPTERFFICSCGLFWWPGLFGVYSHAGL